MSENRSTESTASVVINMRASERTRDLIDQAAAIEGRSRTEFILDAAQRRALDVVLDQRLFGLDPEKYDAFARLLDAPPEPNEALRQLLTTDAPWEDSTCLTTL